ncbi:MAG TPA: transketolase [Epulopiscium sp.]|nr:transketolase [Candidatus Epulonipiscium sp.]
MKKIEQSAIDTIRMLSAEAVQQANSGHPGLPMGAASMAYTLWAKNMKHNPKNPNWTNRDRFVLSAGHGSMLIYSLLHLFGYGLTMEDLKNFRQLGSLTPGHPEYGHTIGVETTTGPLGQGIANAVGMAMAQEFKASHFNRKDMDIVNHHIFAIVGDGCMMEGISSEAASLAGTLKLDKLIVLYDSNNITIEGDTDIAFTEDVRKRFEAYGWHTLFVEDGNNIDEIDQAIKTAKSNHTQPTLIEVKTKIGYGSPAKQGKASAHGEPLGVDNLRDARRFLAHTEAEFTVSSDVSAHMEELVNEGVKTEEEWNVLFESYTQAYPELAKEWDAWNNNELPDFLNDEDFWSLEKNQATRQSSSDMINYLANAMPNLIGGSADLSPSTKTFMNGKGSFSARDYSGPNLHFGVREHAMAAISNGMQLYGGLHTYCATFFIFSDYMKNAMRLSALMNLPVTYVLTHDSIGVGEDGPTHQPVEQLAMLRSMPNMVTFRPADSRETAAAWYYAITSKSNPTSLALSRQDLPVLKKSGKEALKGAYVVSDVLPEDAEIIMIATGSEVQLIVEASAKLAEEGIKAAAISMPSMDLFERQSEKYKNSILPKNKTKRLAVEAASSFGWHKYVGLEGATIAIDHFGESAPADLLFEKYGFTVENVIKVAKGL